MSWSPGHAHSSKQKHTLCRLQTDMQHHIEQQRVENWPTRVLLSFSSRVSQQYFHPPSNYVLIGNILKEQNLICLLHI